MYRSTSCTRKQLSGPLLVLIVLLTTLAGGLGLTSPASAADLALGSNATLGSGQVLRVASGHELAMQSDGNLVLYQNSSAGSHVPVWASNTSGRPGAYLVMQGDGNAVVYQPTATSRVAIWASNTGGRTGAYLVLQDDGNLVIYQPTASGRTPIWATNTSAPTTPVRTCNPNLYLRLSKASGNPSNLTLRVDATRKNCTVTGATFPAASGTGTNQCQKNVGWLPSGDYLVGTYYQNGRGTLAGRSHFDIAPTAATAMCGRSGFAIHSDAGVKVPSTRSDFTRSSNGCIKISGKDLTTLKSLVDGYRADGGQLIGLKVS